jgi:hypothetical protein
LHERTDAPARQRTKSILSPHRKKNSGDPGNVADARQSVCGPGKDEEKVGEAVRVDNRLFIDRFDAGKCDNPSLGTSADGSRDMHQRGGGTASGKDKIVQRGKSGFQMVNMLLQTGTIGFSNPADLLLPFVGRCGKICPQGEEIILDFSEDGINPAIGIEGTAGANDAVELIKRAICLQPEIIFRDTPPSEKRCLPRIAGPGVDLQFVSACGCLMFSLLLPA